MRKRFSCVVGLILACILSAMSLNVVQADSYREMPYDVVTPRSPEDVQKMLDYATFWVGKISYASSQNNTDPDNQRFEELHDGGATDCSWFVYHVLFRFGLLEDDFVHSYEWGNDPDCYPGAHNIGDNIEDAVPGDIICTGEGTKSQNSHVMIYLGDDRIVECAAGKGVVISDAPHHIREIVHFDCIPSGNTWKEAEEVPKVVDTSGELLPAGKSGNYGRLYVGNGIIDVPVYSSTNRSEYQQIVDASKSALAVQEDDDVQLVICDRLCPGFNLSAISPNDSVLLELADGRVLTYRFDSSFIGTITDGDVVDDEGVSLWQLNAGGLSLYCDFGTGDNSQVLVLCFRCIG